LTTGSFQLSSPLHITLVLDAEWEDILNCYVLGYTIPCDEQDEERF